MINKLTVKLNESCEEKRKRKGKAREEREKGA